MSDSKASCVKRPMFLGWLVGADGEDAAGRGLPAESNPFAPSSEAGEQWLSGWRSAQQSLAA